MENYQEIIRLIKLRDPSGLERLFEAYGSKFYSYCIQKWEFDEDDSWEIVYKTLETLIAKVSNYQFRDKKEFERFAYTVLINFLRQHYRSKRYREQNNLVYLDLNHNDGSSSEFSEVFKIESLTSYHEDGLENRELTRLNKVLDMMEEDERDLLLLRAQNYSYSEIAKLLNIEDKQLKVKHHRAKAKLIELMKNTQIKES